MSPEHNKKQAYKHRPEDLRPPDYPFKKNRVRLAIHDGLGAAELAKEGITENRLKEWSELAIKGRHPKEYGSQTFESPEEFEDFILGIIEKDT